MYPAPAPEQIQGLTYGSLTEEQKAANRASYTVWDVVFSLFLAYCLASIMRRIIDSGLALIPFESISLDLSTLFSRA